MSFLSLIFTPLSCAAPGSHLLPSSGVAREKEQQQEEAREQQWQDIYVFLKLDLGSPCFGEEGAKEQRLKAHAQHREIYTNSP